jgi:glycosyltransferase involved in cell wall biosynthesis
MESLLPMALDSLVGSSALDRLDVVVVNDGSRDGSLAVAERYAERYPQSVRVVDKANGNYGSTINAALPTLQGEYVKVLDADDRFDVALVADVIEGLEAMSGVDVVVMPYVECDARGERRVGYNLYSHDLYACGEVYDAERVFADGAIHFFAMHSLAYRTELLRAMGYRQSEGISYTDQEWAFYPMFHAERFGFMDTPLYIYNLAREGQTMDAAVQLRSIGQLERVVSAMAEYYAERAEAVSSAARREFLQGVLVRRMATVYRKYLLDMSDAQFVASDFEAVDVRLSALAKRCGLAPLRCSVNGVLRLDLLGKWRRSGTRYSSMVRSALRWADRVMMRLHELLFR